MHSVVQDLSGETPDKVMQDIAIENGKHFSVTTGEGYDAQDTRMLVVNNDGEPISQNRGN